MTTTPPSAENDHPEPAPARIPRVRHRLRDVSLPEAGAAGPFRRAGVADVPRHRADLARPVVRPTAADDVLARPPVAAVRARAGRRECAAARHDQRPHPGLPARRRPRRSPGHGTDRAAAAGRDPSAAGLVDRLRRRCARRDDPAGRGGHTGPELALDADGRRRLPAADALPGAARTAAHPGGRLAGDGRGRLPLRAGLAEQQRRHPRAAVRAQRHRPAGRRHPAQPRRGAAAARRAGDHQRAQDGPGAPCWRSGPASPASCTTWSPTTCR